MCGLGLILGRDFASGVRMAESMAHRGLTHRVERVGPWTTIHVRLPIVGLGDEFSQPYRHEGWTFLFVGEVVNFKELVPPARSDVEVVARLWASEGPSCVKRFDGFWSIVAIPPEGSPVFVATDYLGKKPVYYRSDVHAFASEIRALVRLGPVTVDEVYFSSVRKWGYHAGPRTWAKEIRKLPPGSLTTLDPLGEFLVREDFDVVEPMHWNIMLELKNAVERRVTSSDIPVSILLSGGLDSSLVYRFASEFRSSDLLVYHAKNTGDTLDALDVKERTIVVEPSTVDYEDALRWNEGPVDLGSVVPQLALARAIADPREGRRDHVALSGDGADELFGGYRRSEEYDSQGSDVYDELVHYHLPRLDKLMMAETVELRCPFLSRRVLSGAMALPWRARRNKGWLRRAAEDYLPSTITRAPKVALKTDEIRENPIARRMFACDLFETMIREKRV